jgi:4-cresol dehydrogenase (hydroxylating)
MIHLLPNSDRSMRGVLAIVFDRMIPKDEEQAIACYNETSRKCLDSGFVPCCLGVQSRDLDLSSSLIHEETIKLLKNALDPNKIIAPNKYGIH